MPPESNVMPLPTRATGAEAAFAPRYSITISFGGWSDPWVTDRNEPIFRRLMSALSRILARTVLWSLAIWRARDAR